MAPSIEKGFRILRYGEEWRDETGDKAILAVIQRVKELEEQMKAAGIFG